MAVEEKVKQIIVEQLQVDEAEVTPGASFQEDLGADSLDVVEDVYKRQAYCCDGDKEDEQSEHRQPFTTPRRNAEQEHQGQDRSSRRRPERIGRLVERGGGRRGTHGQHVRLRRCAADRNRRCRKAACRQIAGA